VAGAVLGLALVQLGTSASAAPPAAELGLTSGQVVAALRQAGLSVEGLRQQPVGGSASPSGPPATEREAWGFEIAGLAPRGGRILIFADDRPLQQKAAWFRRAGASVIGYRNVILWLDPAVEPGQVARYRAALEELK
jgi:hypothetical protein